MKLIPITERPDAAQILWDLLVERTPEQSISHKAMPTWEDHERFVASRPYLDWLFIDAQGQSSGPKRHGDIVGAIYLTDRYEIGVSVFRDYQRLGIGPHAVRLLMQKHGKMRYLANINPSNEASKAMWQKLGFVKVQETYAPDAD